MKNKLYVVGIGPGIEEMMTGEAIDALEQADVIVGYTVYLKLLGERFQGKEMLSTPMKQEVERCRLAFEEAMKGKKVALICSGDAGIYGMASLMYEIGKDYPEIELQIIAGVTAASSGAAVLGAPLNHDFCIISLSDLLTPWEKIEKRLIAAAQGDFAISIYNPSSHKRKDYLQKACDILLRYIEGDRACGYVENIGREGTKAVTCTLAELRNAQVNMFTTVFIGNSESKIINGKLITKRGYQIEGNTDICRNN
jgi:precorrin-3B C17-methyltransferase